MSKGGVDRFAFVMNYLNDTWIPRHAIIRLFEVMKLLVVPWLCNFDIY
jgi:hypothetical protein